MCVKGVQLCTWLALGAADCGEASFSSSSSPRSSWSGHDHSTWPEVHVSQYLLLSQLSLLIVERHWHSSLMTQARWRHINRIELDKKVSVHQY